MAKGNKMAAKQIVETILTRIHGLLPGSNYDSAQKDLDSEDLLDQVVAIIETSRRDTYSDTNSQYTKKNTRSKKRRTAKTLRRLSRKSRQ